ncbi:unnamed protein product [Rhizophagus irregularis]|nr:unnamed protein product [Rhizophagus irregularis]CAB5189701.1 unnamed protein product [Rhizophagus irregularis]
MKECWHSNPNKRPTATELETNISSIWNDEPFYLYGSYYGSINPNGIINSADIGPIKINNPGAIYKSRPLSVMIKSAESTRSLKTRNCLTNELVDNNINLSKYGNSDSDYMSEEINFDI